MKKTIKYNYVGLAAENNYERFYSFFAKRLENKYDFVFSDNPDFVFISCYNNDFSFNKFNCVRIGYMHENMHPDFQFFDYFIGYNCDLSFGDRYCYIIPAILTLKPFLKNDYFFKTPTLEEAKKICSEKIDFCDFTYNHEREDGLRGHYYKLLNNYKNVSVNGVFNGYDNTSLNKYSYNFEEKLNRQKKCKFTLVIESCKRSGGLVTEKIFHSIIANTVPIYIGEDAVLSIVNEKRIINVKDFKTEEELMLRIKEIDEDDNLFSSIISTEPLKNRELFKELDMHLTIFLDKIFSQDPDKAFRRPENEYRTLYFNSFINRMQKVSKAKIFKFFLGIRHFFLKLFKK